jgi:hypothetical protein
MSTCNTADGIDHGDSALEDCLEAIIERYEDGYVLCPIIWSGGSCEDCMEILERRMDRYDD